ncbi:hypothetical protein [Arthrobacter sp. GMC3]|uniref:hypothetical protein n=1 Tax=Arthrobacter sp. GMC3 TaxID=2058894 RepID=UPI000CE45CED|nr:hypothetical protein [Arthrobacter sp. GMC3]
MSTTTTQPATPFQAQATLARSLTVLQAAAAKVVVSDAGVEIHGYVITRRGNHFRVVWAVASGRHRQRTFTAETVFQPGNDRRWSGYPIPDEHLAALCRATR